MKTSDDWSASYSERATGTIVTVRPSRGCSHDWQDLPGTVRWQHCAHCGARGERDKDGRLVFYDALPKELKR